MTIESQLPLSCFSKIERHRDQHNNCNEVLKEKNLWQASIEWKLFKVGTIIYRCLFFNRKTAGRLFPEIVIIISFT